MTTTLSFICRIILGGLFVTAGLAKISDPVRFLLTLREFRIFPDMIERFMAVTVPWLEFILGLFLLLGLLYRASALLFAGLNGVFIVAIGSVLARGIKVDCGCFGLLADVLHLPDHADGKAIVRNLVLIGLSVYVFRSESSAWTLEGYIRRSVAGKMS